MNALLETSEVTAVESVDVASALSPSLASALKALIDSKLKSIAYNEKANAKQTELFKKLVGETLRRHDAAIALAHELKSLAAAGKAKAVKPIISRLRSLAIKAVADFPAIESDRFYIIDLDCYVATMTSDDVREMLAERQANSAKAQLDNALAEIERLKAELKKKKSVAA